MIREIHSEETGKLYECLEALAEHHNRVSVHFKGRYPQTPSREKIKQFESELEEGKSRIAVIENDSSIVGFYRNSGIPCRSGPGNRKRLRRGVNGLGAEHISKTRNQ